MPRGSNMKQYAGLNGSFALQLEQFKLDALAAIEQTRNDIIIQIGESVINLSPVLTGRFKKNWVFTVNAPANYSLIGFDKDGSEAIAALIAGVNAMELGQKAYITNSVRYAIPLEHGYSQKAPAGMVKITLARFQQIVDQAVKLHQI